MRTDTHTHGFVLGCGGGSPCSCLLQLGRRRSDLVVLLPVAPNPTKIVGYDPIVKGYNTEKSRFLDPQVVIPVVSADAGDDVADVIPIFTCQVLIPNLKP